MEFLYSPFACIHSFKVPENIFIENLSSIEISFLFLPKSEVVRHRLLSFFDGTAYGTLYPDVKVQFVKFFV